MSQESENTTPEAKADGPAPAEAPKKKKGFWGWLTGGSEPEGAPPADGPPATAEPEAVTAPLPEGPVSSAPEEASSALPPSETDAGLTAEPYPVAEAPDATVAEEIPAPRVPEPSQPPAPADATASAETVAPEPEPSDAAGPDTPSAAEQREPGQAPEETLPPEPAPAIAEAALAAEAPKKGFWSRLVSGLSRTAGGLTQGITDLVTKRKLDEETLEELEDLLIRADLGTDTAMRIVAAVAKGRHDKMISPEEVKALIAAEVETILAPVAKPLVIDTAHKPFVVLMVGVNGSGKTTTIGKLAAQWRAEGRKVVLAAGDTFRAAAIEQLKVWGARTGATVIARESGADAAGVAFDAYATAKAEGADILMIDTAGRLQNRAELMAELEKVVRVVKKQEPTAPHAVLLVLDATVGQNALSQVEAFSRTAGVTGLVMTKLDGTARGGILVAIAGKHKMPIHLIGVGEGADDLQPFTARDFARAIAGLA